MKESLPTLSSMNKRGARCCSSRDPGQTGSKGTTKLKTYGEQGSGLPYSLLDHQHLIREFSNQEILVEDRKAELAICQPMMGVWGEGRESRDKGKEIGI